MRKAFFEFKAYKWEKVERKGVFTLISRSNFLPLM